MTHSIFNKQSLERLLSTMPLHGGDLDAATKQFAVPKSAWIDLSTGINQNAYPIPNIPVEYFCHLPYTDNEFIRAVNHYYNQGKDQPAFIALPGSQYAIQILPRLLNTKLPVLLPNIGYKEHEKVWNNHSIKCNYYDAIDEVNMCESVNTHLAKNTDQHLVIIQPNNPTSVIVSCEQLMLWSNQMTGDACLIIDEAFIDITPSKSILSTFDLPKNIIVLRSFGKFFGLAGIRLGFIFASDEIVAKASAVTGLWQINGPAQYIAKRVLMDTQWHEQARRDISTNAALTAGVFAKLTEKFPVKKFKNAGLFISYFMPKYCTLILYYLLANHGILTRVIVLSDEDAILRLGLLDHQNKQQVDIVSDVIETILRDNDLESLIVSI